MRTKKQKKTSTSKADVFFKRTAGAIKALTSASTSVDGLSLSLAMRGRVDMGYISDLTGKSETEIVKELGDMIYKNPDTNLYELTEEYLSGNVDLTESDISPHLGATWIKPEYYEAFINHVLNNNAYDVEVSYSGVTGTWNVSGRTGYGQEVYKRAVSGTKWNLLSLLEAALNKKSPTVTKDNSLTKQKRLKLARKLNS